MQVIGIDPGKHCGWASFIDGTNDGLGILEGEPEIWEFIRDTNPDVWVVENYKLRPYGTGGMKYDHAWSELFTIRVIGAIQYKAYVEKQEFVLQEPTIKRPAMGLLSGKVYQKKSNQHALDAYLHAYYYIVKKVKAS